MIGILSADLLIADMIAPLVGHPALLELARKYDLAPGSKKTLSAAAAAEFAAAVEGITVSIAPGGSSANMLSTLARLLNKEVAIKFLGIAGDDAHGQMVRQSLTEAGITLLPAMLPSAQVGISYVVMFHGGQRAIATWPGNARTLLTPEMISEELVQGSDAVLVQGSLWHKFDRAVPERLVDLCRMHRKKLWLTLPTQSEFASEDSVHIRGVLPRAALILGNDSELTRIFGLSLDASLAALQEILRGEQVGFITCGHKGGAVVTVDAIEKIAPVPVESIVNTLGAGDTAFAAFAAGYLKGLPHPVSAQMAMALAAEKLKVDGPRLADPKAALHRVRPDINF